MKLYNPSTFTWSIANSACSADSAGLSPEAAGRASDRKCVASVPGNLARMFRVEEDDIYHLRPFAFEPHGLEHAVYPRLVISRVLSGGGPRHREDTIAAALYDQMRRVRNRTRAVPIRRTARKRRLRHSGERQANSGRLLQLRVRE